MAYPCPTLAAVLALPAPMGPVELGRFWQPSAARPRNVATLPIRHASFRSPAGGAARGAWREREVRDIIICFEVVRITTDIEIERRHHCALPTASRSVM